MVAATTLIFNQYHVDLSTAFSAPSLAMKIFRTCFLTSNIPLLPNSLEAKVRNSSKGGAVQVIKTTGANLHYSDVNSLYPYSMTTPMPIFYLDSLLAKDINLDTFTGFIFARIIVPDSVIPVVPFHSPNSDRLEYPKGKFEGLFYAEELRSAKSLGCEVTPIHGYLFSTKDLFYTYVHHFYNYLYKED